MSRLHLFVFDWIACPAVIVLRYGILWPFRHLGWPDKGRP